MALSLADFPSELFSNPMLAVTAALAPRVILVNGWTDAANAIVTCVSTRAMTPSAAILMATVCNFAGVLLMTLPSSKVAIIIYNMVDFGGPRDASIALCAALFAIVVWATAAWFFGIPTSESHALIAGLSTLLGFGATRIVKRACRGISRPKAERFFKRAQICSGAAMAFMHGAQGEQKFMSIFLLGIALSGGNANVSAFTIPIWLMLLCSVVMALGTSIGGSKIIRSAGMNNTFFRRKKPLPTR